MKFWRRVFVWDLEAQRWNVARDHEYDALQPWNCVFDGPTWCGFPQPYVYEQQWKFLPGTIGGSQGSWSYLGGRVNWGSQVET